MIKTKFKMFFMIFFIINILSFQAPNAYAIDNENRIEDADRIIEEPIEIPVESTVLSDQQREENKAIGLPENLTQYEVLTLDTDKISESVDNRKSSTFTIELGENIFSFDSTFYEYDMSKFGLIGEDGIIEETKGDQIIKIDGRNYNNDTGSFILSSSIIFGTMVINDIEFILTPLLLEKSPSEFNHFALYRPLDIKSTVDSTGPVDKFDESAQNSCSGEINILSAKLNPSVIKYSTDFTTDFVMSASFSFYEIWGWYGWAEALLDLWDGGYASDAKSMLESNAGNTFNQQYAFAFKTDNGPSSTNAHIFLSEFSEVMDDLSSYHPAYHPDLAWMASGHDFSGTTLGATYGGSLGTLPEYDSDTDTYYGPHSVISALGSITREERHVLTHEISHAFLPARYDYNDNFYDTDKTDIFWTDKEFDIPEFQLVQNFMVRAAGFGGNNPGQSVWRKSSWTKVVEIDRDYFNSDGIEKITVDYNYDFVDTDYMGSIRLEGYNTNTGKRTFLIMWHDAWSGSNAKPYLYGYGPNGNLLANPYVGQPYSDYQDDHGQFIVDFGTDYDQNNFVYLKIINDNGQTTHSRPFTGVGETTEVKLTVLAHDKSDYTHQYQEWVYTNYMEESSTDIDHHENAATITVDCWPIDLTEYTVMASAYRDYDWSCSWWNYDHHRSVFIYSDFNKFYLNYYIWRHPEDN